MVAEHTTTVLLYLTTAGTVKQNVVRTWEAIISGRFSSDNCVPLTLQLTTPDILTLQLKVALHPSVALTDLGVLVNTGTTIQERKQHNRIQLLNFTRKVTEKFS